MGKYDKRFPPWERSKTVVCPLKVKHVYVCESNLEQGTKSPPLLVGVSHTREVLFVLL